MKWLVRGLGLASAGALLLACGGGEVEFEGTGGGGSGGNVGTGGEGTTTVGSGGAGGTIIPDGDPIEAPANTWTWVDFPDAMCRDGSTTGIGVNLNPDSTEVAIFLMGGGACWTGITCANNPSTYGSSDFSGMNLSTGIFDRTNPDNPVADWNLIFVPYCTGDVHAGSNPNAMVAGTPQMFVGYDNMKAYLNRIVPTFPNATKILLTGSSAGGFGAASTSHLVQRTFGDVEVVTLDDAGPAMRGEYLAPCLQEAWRDTWGLDETFLGACGDNCPDKTDFLVDYVKWVSAEYPTRRSALLSTTSDQVIRTFFGLGENNCASFTPMSPQKFEQGLNAFADEMQSNTQFGIFYAPGSAHTFLGGNSFYDTEVNNVRMVDFVSDLIDGSTSQVR